MITTNEILSKQSEILSHQKNFNLILAIVTTFLVLIYALNGASFFSRYSGIGSDIITIIMIFILIVLIIFMNKQGYFKKILKIIGIIK